VPLDTMREIVRRLEDALSRRKKNVEN